MASTRVDITYAVDEDLYVVGGGDFAVIVPRSNRMAAGSDGVFAANAPWVLSSASNAFISQGLAAGMMVEIKGPTTTYNPPQFLAIETVAANSLTLRRPGSPTGEGLGPGPAAGLTGVTFTVHTLKPQIENAAFELNRRWSVDPRLSGRKPVDLYEPRVFRRLTALWVLYQQYGNLNRAKTGDFADKVAFYKHEFDEALASCTVEWGASGDDQPATTRFSTRLSR
jgi:hypothetical protein